ncbi:MAG: helix-turn-helix transcriptional regulator [Pseudomonadota bacterium]
MLSHHQVWHGIDSLAAKNGLSASGLAKKAGLDPTTFNKSKRTTKLGKPRWPSTESLAKILSATTTSMIEFVELMQMEKGSISSVSQQRVKCVALSEVGAEGSFDSSGFPVGEVWDEIEFPLIDDDGAFAIELDEDIAPPCYRAGDLLVVSPGSSVRRHDRVMIYYQDRSVQFGVLTRRTAQRLAVRDLDGGGEEQSVQVGEVAWIGRIVWLSQ